MKLGYFTQPFHPSDRKVFETLKEDHYAALIADRNGYREAFFGEHVTDKFETITSSLAFISSLAYVTKNIYLGTGTINLPNSNPAQVASSVSMIDNMLEGRFILGISMGALPTDWEIFGSLNYDKEKMFEECISQITSLWTEKAPYGLHGEFWNTSTTVTFNSSLGLGEIMKPFQKPYPEIVCTALTPKSKGLFKAGQKGWSPISSNFLQPNAVKTHWESFEKGVKKNNKIPDPQKWRIARMIFVNEDNSLALKYGKSVNGPYGKCIEQILKKLKFANKLNILKECENQPDEEITLDYCIDKLVVAGDPPAVKDQLLEFNNIVGPYGTLLYVGVDWQDKELAKKSMELMSNKVMINL